MSEVVNIELTRDEALSLLKAFSRIEGFLFAVDERRTSEMFENLDYPIGLLTEKLGGKR